MKSKKRIEVLVKVLWILCLIVFICCCVGAVGCVIGLGVFSAVQGIEFDGKTIADMIVEKGVSVNDAYTGMAIGLFHCVVEGFLAMYLGLFFKKHSEKGVVFDKPLVKETRTVAIVYVIVSLAASILSGVGVGIAKVYDKTISVKSGGYISLAFAVCMLIVSLFLDYIADIEAQKPAVEEEPAQIENKEE